MSAGHCNLCIVGELQPPWNPGDLYRCKNPHCKASNIAPLEENPARVHVRVLPSIDIPVPDVDEAANARALTRLRVAIDEEVNAEQTNP